MDGDTAAVFREAGVKLRQFIPVGLLNNHHGTFLEKGVLVLICDLRIAGKGSYPSRENAVIVGDGGCSRHQYAEPCTECLCSCRHPQVTGSIFEIKNPFNTVMIINKTSLGVACEVLSGVAAYNSEIRLSYKHPKQ